MSSLFFDHGSPLTAIEDTDFTRAITELGISLPRPEKIIIISAHWLSRGSHVSIGAHPRPPMIYDMYGFPEELYEVVYPAPGDPDEAGAIEAFLTAEGLDVSLDTERGLDHGIWSMLVHLYPDADIPVIPLSIAYDAGGEFQYRIGRLLRSFAKERNILLIFSGNIVHNLRMLDFSGGPSFPWAEDFIGAIESRLSPAKRREIIDYHLLSGNRESVPTPDHFYPFLAFLGSTGDRPIREYHRGMVAGSITTYIYGSD